MSSQSLSPLARSAARVTLGSLVLTLAVAAPAYAQPAAAKPAHAAQSGCAGADTPTSNIRRIKRVVLCLHNLQRGGRGLSKLRWNGNLSGVASKYARSMVAGRSFAHSSAGHRDHMDRIAASAYKPSSGCWTAGENLYSSAGPATPRRILSAWMASPAHRQNILLKGWHDFGLGVVGTSPQGNAKGLTIVALFGLRTHRNCS